MLKDLHCLLLKTRALAAMGRQRKEEVPHFGHGRDPGG